MRKLVTAGLLVLSSAACAGAAGTARPKLFQIDHVKQLGPRTLEVYYAQGYVPCYGKLGHVAVKAGKQTVTITLHRTYPEPYDPHRMCAQFQAVKSVKVDLHHPLGTRTVIDGATGKSEPAPGGGGT